MRSLHSKLKDYLHYGTDSGRITWVATGKDATTSTGYGTVIVKLGRKTFKAEKLAIFLKTGAWPEHYVGFRNLDPQDLKYRNLHQHQGQSQDKGEGGKAQTTSDNKSGVVGVVWHVPSKKWVAKFQFKGKDYHCGHFLRIEIAKMALDAKREEVGAPKK